MANYSIKDLEHLSGIKAHTIRVWEQRYEIIVPKRTATNIRYYDDEDLRLILNISFLNRNGLKISRIASLSTEEIAASVRKIADSSLETSNQIDALVMAMVNLDIERFEKVISTNSIQFGFESTMLNIVYPFLGRIGILWQTGSINPVHEHFIANLIRQKLIVAIDGQVEPSYPEAKRYLLFLPEKELHELSLLFSSFVIKSRHNKVMYLGQSTPLDDLEVAVNIYKADYLMTVVSTYPQPGDVVTYVQELRDKFPETQLLISGYNAIQSLEDLPIPGVTVFKSLDEMVEFVDTNSLQPYGNTNNMKLNFKA